MSELTVDLGRFARGEDLAVDPARIDAELDRMWREIARRVRDGRPGTPAVHRACLFNLVAVAGDAHDEIVARFVVAALTDRMPARAVVVRARPGERDDGPHAWIASLRDPERHGPAQVSGELVVLAASGAGVPRLPPIVRSVLEPELSTTLWWVGAPPADARHVAEFCGIADRIVVDSAAFPPDADVSHAFACRDPGRLADLAWPRQRPWRQALARAFDVPASRPFLARVEAVEIGVGRRARVASAALLGGWLAEALAWDAHVPAGPGAVRFGDDGAELRVTRRDVDAEGVVDVRLVAGAEDVVLERRPAPERVEVRVPASFPAVRAAAFHEPRLDDVLASAVLAAAADPIAPDAIRRAARIAADLGRA